MQRRLGFVLALLVAGAPQALAACQLACAASMEHGSVAEHHDHSSSHSPAPIPADPLRAGPQPCGHAPELAEAPGRGGRIAADPAVLTTVFKSALPLRTAGPFFRTLHLSPPGPDLPAAPLRV